MSNIESSREWLEKAWNQRDVSIVDRIAADNYINHDPTGDFVGAEAQKAFIQDFLAAFPNIKVTIDQISGSGNDVTSHVTFTGTQTGALATPQGTIPPTGKTVVVKVKITDQYNQAGKLTETWAEWDPNDMMRQLASANRFYTKRLLMNNIEKIQNVYKAFGAAPMVAAFQAD